MTCGLSEITDNYLNVQQDILETFIDRGQLRHLTQPTITSTIIADDMLENLPAASQVGKTLVGGIDLNKSRMRWVVEGVIALSALPAGFTASDLAAHVCAISGQSLSQYGPRRAAYDLKKLRGKRIVRRIGQTCRYEPLPVGLRNDRTSRTQKQGH